MDLLPKLDAMMEMGAGHVVQAQINVVLEKETVTMITNVWAIWNVEMTTVIFPLDLDPNTIAAMILQNLEIRRQNSFNWCDILKPIYSDLLPFMEHIFQ